MKCNETLKAKIYLNRFRQILDEMANKMLCTDISNNITINFIRCMIPHHQAAIYMCENLLKYTNYLPLQKIASNIIQMQTKGIEQMKKILYTTPAEILNLQNDVNCYMSKYYEITKRMIYRMRNSPRCININLNFVNEMIPHHEGAIAMCNNLLQYNVDSRLKIVAKSIIEEQTQGVAELENIMKILCNMH